MAMGAMRARAFHISSPRTVTSLTARQVDGFPCQWHVSECLCVAPSLFWRPEREPVWGQRPFATNERIFELVLTAFIFFSFLSASGRRYFFAVNFLKVFTNGDFRTNQVEGRFFLRLTNLTVPLIIYFCKYKPEETVSSLSLLVIENPGQSPSVFFGIPPA